MQRAITAKVGTLEQEYATFMDVPGDNGPVEAMNNLKKVHSGTAGKLLLNLIDYVCKGAPKILAEKD